jgi:hypothetical protein
MRRFNMGMTGTAEIIEAQLIEHDEQDIARFGH